MESKDNIVTFPDSDDREKGRGYTIMRGSRQAMMLEIKIPVPGRQNVWVRTGFPYATIEECIHNQEELFIKLHDGRLITITGDNLGRLFDAILDHKLRMVRPLLESESRKEDEPRPIKIIIEDKVTEN